MLENMPFPCTQFHGKDIWGISGVPEHAQDHQDDGGGWASPRVPDDPVAGGEQDRSRHQQTHYQQHGAALGPPGPLWQVAAFECTIKCLSACLSVCRFVMKTGLKLAITLLFLYIFSTNFQNKLLVTKWAWWWQILKFKVTFIGVPFVNFFVIVTKHLRATQVFNWILISLMQRLYIRYCHFNKPLQTSQ